jgi:hypothetical protein
MDRKLRINSISLILFGNQHTQHRHNQGNEKEYQDVQGWVDVLQWGNNPFC